MLLAAARSALLRHAASAAWVGLALTTAPGARADDLRGARTDDLLEEKRHLVEVILDRGHAEIVARRTVENGSQEADEVQVALDLPDGAVATRLRTLGALDGQAQWFSAELFGATEARTRYDELNGVGAGSPRASTVLLAWESQGRLNLAASPILAGRKKTIEYTLKMPTQYKDGLDRLELPRSQSGGIKPDYIVRPARKGDAVVVDGVPVKSVAYLKMDDAEDALSLGLVRAEQPALDGALAVVPFAKDRVLVRWRIEAAAKLSRAPRGAHVVILLDASRSTTTAEGSAALTAAQVYLSHLSDAKVCVLSFDRQVHDVTDGFVPAARAAAILGSLTIVRRNGSRIDDALARADALLAKAPASAPRRILALTDLLARSDVDPEHLHLGAKSGAIVHAAAARSGIVDLSREDGHDWAKAVRATGGLVWQASVSSQADERAAMRRTYEEWVRPTRIDQLALRVSGIDPDNVYAPSLLEEGQSLEELRIEAKEVPRIEIEGELWAQPVRRVIAPDAQEGLLWSAQVFGSTLFFDLSEDEMRTLARRGQVVSPVTSLLAVEPEAGPWAGGFEDHGFGSFSSRTPGARYGSGFGRGTSGRGTSSAKELAWLQASLAAARRQCGGGTTAARLTVETTRAEVVDVSAPRIRGVIDGSKPWRCLTEAAWNLDLPPDLFRRSRGTFSVQL